MTDLDSLRARTGLDLAGSFAFGDSPEMADRLLDDVAAGNKRATAATFEELEAVDDPFPQPGQFWALLDGQGDARFVAETVEVTRGRLTDVTPAFAWDEGEEDRTRSGWLDGHRQYFRRQGIEHPDDVDVLFERFRIVWPQEDTPVWLAEGVRELRFDERDWAREVYSGRWGTTKVASRGRLHDVGDLPALVYEVDGQRAGLLTFRPEPGVEVECVTVDAFVRGVGVGAALTAGIRELARRSEWRRVWLVTTNDNTSALRAYQRAGWDLVALHRDAVKRSRDVKPTIPERGADDIPIRHELELELGLG